MNEKNEICKMITCSEVGNNASSNIDVYWHLIYDFFLEIYDLHNNLGIKKIIFDVNSSRLVLFKNILKHLPLDLEILDKNNDLFNDDNIKTITMDEIKLDPSYHEESKLTSDYVKFLRSLIDTNQSKENYFDKIILHRDYRYIDKEILNFLINEKDFKEVELGNLNIKEQANLIYNANYVISSHGSALANIIFSSTSTKFLELNNGFNPTCFVRTAKHLVGDKLLIKNKSIKSIDYHILFDEKMMEKMVDMENVLGPPEEYIESQRKYRQSRGYTEMIANNAFKEIFKFCSKTYLMPEPNPKPNKNIDYSMNINLFKKYYNEWAA